MASNARCLCFLFLLFLSSSHQTQARDSKFFSKVSHEATKKSKENQESITLSPIESPTLAPALAPESEVVEHGYGLYGSESYQYPPTTTDPVKTTTLVGEEKHAPAEELKKHNFEEFEMGYSNNNYNGKGNGNGYVTEKQGMSDTRFLENGKYYHDVNMEGKNENINNGNGYGNEKERVNEYVNYEDKHPENKGNGNEYVGEKQGMSDTRFLNNGLYYHDVKDENSFKGNEFMNKEGMSEYINEEERYPENKLNGSGNEFVSEKQGMSDTRFLENGKYYHDVNRDAKDENNYQTNKWYGNGYESEKRGMSDTRFRENGKYHYDIGNEKGNVENNYNYNNNEEHPGYVTKENGYGNEKEHYNYNPYEYDTEVRGEFKGNAKKLPPNQYDTIEEYEKEQEYKQNQNEYVP